MVYDPYDALGVERPATTAAPVASAKVGYDPYTALGVDKPEVGGLRAAAKQVVGSTIKGAGQLGADFIPSVGADNALVRKGQEIIDANPTAIQGFGDIADKPGTFVKEAVGNALPSVGGMIGLRALGAGITAAAPLAGPAAPLVAGAGQLVSWAGPTVMAALPSYGGIRETQEDDSVGSKLLALGSAAAVGRIEQMAGGEALAGKLISKVGRDQLTKATGKMALAKTVGKEAGKAAVGEAAEEGLQNPIEQLAGYQNPLTPANIEETALGMTMGAVGGGVLGGAMGPFVHTAAKDAPPPDPTVEEVQKQALAKATGGEVEINNGLATITSGGNTLTAPVEVLTQHFVAGKTLDDFDTAAATAPKLEELRTALQDDDNPLSFNDIVALRDDPDALKQVGVNRKDIDALIEAEIERGALPDAAWIKQERLAQQTNQAAFERLQGLDARVQAAQANEQLNQTMNEQVTDYWTRLMQVPGQPSTAPAGTSPAVGPPPSPTDTSPAGAVVPLPTAATSAFAGQTELTPAQFEAERTADYAALFDEAARRESDRVVRRQALEAEAAEAVQEPPPVNLDRQVLSRLTELEQKAQGLPGVSTSTSLTMQEEQEYTALRAQASPADAQALQQYQANVARRDALMLKQQGSPAFETVGEGGQATVVPAAPPQTLTPKEQTELAQLTKATRQPPVSPYTDDSRTLAAGLPASQSDTLFSQGVQQGEPLNAPALTTTIDAAFGKGTVSRLTRQGKLQIVASAAEVPGVGPLSADQQRKAQGVYRSKEGKIYLVANNLSRGNVLGVFKHEVVHALLRQDATFMARRETLLKDFAKLLGKDASVDAAAAKVPAGTQAQVKTEEALAYWVQNEANHKHSLFKRMVAVVKAALKRLGIPTTSMTTADFSLLFARGTQEFVGSTQSTIGVGGAVKALYSQVAEMFGPKWRSRLAEAVQSKGSTQSASNWLKTLETWEKKGTIPAPVQEELEWSGLKEYLQSIGDQKISRTDIVTYLSENGVQVQEVVKGDGLTKPKPFTVEQDGDQWVVLDNNQPNFPNGRISDGPFTEEWEANSRAESLNEDIENGEYEGWNGERSVNIPKFASYQLPGGQNYKELLLTLPNSKKQAPRMYQITDANGNIYANNFTSRQLAEEARDRLEIENDVDLYVDSPNGIDELTGEIGEYADRSVYHSSHFDEPNILAHVRFNERVDAQGNKVLFIEEVQSDWHQEGRKKGYKENLTPEKIARLEQQHHDLTMAALPMPAESKEYAQNYAERSRIQNILDGSNETPDAPFKNSWSLLAMKRMIRYAAENGFDKIAWTTGEQQAERYDLSKQVDKIYYSPYEDGTFEVTATLKNGAEIPGTAGKMDQQKIADTFGKEVADKIVSGVSTGKDDGTSYLSGLDLKVGGEGMKAFYDKMLPSSVGKFIKQFGGKVEAVPFDNMPNKKRRLDLIRQRRELEINSPEWRRLSEEIDQLSLLETGKAKSAVAAEQPGFTLTPTMRESALGEGMPLFSGAQFKTVDVNSPEFKRWFGNSKVVDKDGKPLRVRHETWDNIRGAFIPGGITREAAEDRFTTLRPDEMRDPANVDKAYRSGPVIYFGDLGKGVGSGRSVDKLGARYESPKSYVAYLSIQNPLVIETEQDRKYAIAALYTAGPLGADFPYTVSTKQKKDLIFMGYDGIILDIPNEGREFIAFSSVQVKSALANTGDFSLDNPDILFSQASTAHAAARGRTTANLKELAAERLTEFSPFFLRVSPLRTLAQTLGTKIKQIGAISNAFDEMNHISTSMVEDAKGNYDEHQKLNKKATGSNDKFNLAATTATFYRMTPWKKMEEQDWVGMTGTREERLQSAEQKWKAAGMDKATGKSFIAAYIEAAKAYHAIGSQEAQDQYRKMARHMRHIRQREETNVLATIENATIGNATLRAAMMERFNATFKNISGTYWPLTREGEYILQYKDAGGQQVVEHFLTAKDRRLARQALEESGATEMQQGYASKTPRGQVAIPGELMQQFSQAIVAEKTKGLDPEQDAEAFQAAAQAAQDTINDLNQIWLRWQPETAALKNAIQRRNVKGYDLNAGRAYLEYVQRHAQSIAWTEQGRVIEDQMKGMQDQIKADRKAGLNIDLKQMVLNDLRERVQAARDTHVGPIASMLGKIGTAYYMTSPSIALVQMTQLPMLTLPKLGVMYNSGAKAAKALMTAVQDSFSKKFSRDAMYGDKDVNELFNATRLVVTDEMRKTLGETDLPLGAKVYSGEEIAKSFAKLSPYQQKLFILRESLARNLLDISATHEAYAIAQGKNPDSAWRKAFDLAMTPMRLSEQASRKAAILATMELAQAQGKGYNRIMADVHEVVQDTLFSYDKTNKPVFLQGSTGRVLAMFQWYRIMSMFRMGLLFKRSIKAETPEIRTAAQKELIGIVGMSGALAGTIGLPMASAMFAALNAALGDDDEPVDTELEWRNMLKEQFGERLGDIAAYGLPAALGMHLTKRIGMGDTFGMQSSPPPQMAGKDLAAWWAANQLGPAFSIGQSWVQGYDEIVNKGNVMRGLEVAMPKPIKDAMKAIRVGTEGEMTTISGKRVLGPDKITADMVPLLALGFNPLEAAKVNENTYSRTKLGAQLSRRRGRLIEDAAQALQGEGDVFEAKQALMDFNRKNPAFAIKGGEIRVAAVRGTKEGLGVPSKRERMLNSAYGIPSVE